MPIRQGVQFPHDSRQRKTDEVAGHVDDAGALVHDDQPAGTHHRALIAHRFVGDGGIQLAGRQAAAQRSAGLDGFERQLGPAANFLHDLAQGRSKRHLDQAGMSHFTHQ